MPETIKTLLRALLDCGYCYLARDPGDRSLYAYRTRPHLEDDFYTLSDEEMERSYSCIMLTPGGIDMFINDHDISELYNANPSELARIPVDATDEPVEINALL